MADDPNSGARWAHGLEGKELPGGWVVVRKLSAYAGLTGGRFSVRYEVRGQRGQQAFLKALDYSPALEQFPPEQQPRVMEQLLRAFNFECELYELCTSRRMDRVVRVLDKGYIVADPAPFVGTVQFVVLEWGGRDLRELVSVERALSEAAALRAVHHLATGVRQLHGARVGHNDIKPSNTLYTDAGVAKLGDLGCALRLGVQDEAYIDGDRAHAPPEVQYGFEPADWEERVLGRDFYLLGSLISFLFLGAALSPAIRARLRDEHRWNVWTGSFQDVLPFLQSAFGRVLAEFEPYFPRDAGELLVAVRQLSEPDPAKRGWVLNRQPPLPRFDLQRLVARANEIATRAAIRARRANQ